MRPIVLDKRVQFCDPSLNRSREIPAEAGGGGMFDSFFRCNFQPEVGNDVMSDVAVDYVIIDVHVCWVFRKRSVPPASRRSVAWKTCGRFAFRQRDGCGFPLRTLSARILISIKRP